MGGKTVWGPAPVPTPSKDEEGIISSECIQPENFKFGSDLPYWEESKKPRELNPGELTNKFVELRDKLTAKRRDFKDLEINIKTQMEEIEMQLIEMQSKLGVTSLSTKTHTAFQVTKTYVRMGDWDTFSKYILKSGNIHLVEKRVAKLATLELEAEDGVDLSTIGVDKSSEVAIQIRKK
jgi:hypothetical protein